MRIRISPTVIGLVLTILAAGNSSAASAQTAAAPRRSVAGAVRVISLDEGLGDLGYVTVMAADASHIVVFDQGEGKVRMFDRAGRPLWSTGRIGSAPGEFRAVTAIRLGADSAVYVSDNGLRRVTVLSRDGRLRSTRPMAQNVFRELPVRGDTTVAMVTFDSTLVRFVGKRRIGALRMPATLRFLDTLTGARESAVAVTPNGALAMLFIFSGTLGYVAPGSGTVVATAGVDPRPWPRETVTPMPERNGRRAFLRGLPPSARPAMISLAATDSLAVALTWAPADSVGRFLDIYALPSLDYRCSLSVPAALREIALSGRRIVGRVDEPEPALVRLEPSLDALPAACAARR